MPSFGHRSVLRLRRAAMSSTAAQIRPPTRQLTTALAYNHLSAGLPPFMLGGSTPSPVASSSRMTLDTFLDRSHEDIIWSALSFAAEDELVTAALAPPGTSMAGSRWIDPASAYVALRSSGLFSHHLVALLPRIRTLYTNLKASGMHQLLVSDLLLRNPDPRALREILLEETDPVHRHAAGEKLRAGLIVQIYAVISPSIRRRTATRLSRPALIAVSKALRAQDALDMLPEVFFELAHTTDWNSPQSVWAMLDVALFLSQRGRSQEALKLLHYPIALGKLPSNALGRTAVDHPEAAALLVQSAIARTALAWGLDKRATRAVDAILDTMIRSQVSIPSLELVLQSCRAADLSRDPELVAWAGRTLIRIAEHARFPPLPSAALNIHLDALSRPAALNFYSALPAGRHESVAPHHVLSLALLSPSRSFLRRLADDISRASEDASAAIPGIIRLLASARLLSSAQKIYNVWRHRAPAALVDGHTAIALTRAFTRGARTSQNTAFARRVMADYVDTTGLAVRREDRAAALVHMHALVSDGARDPAALAAQERELTALTSALGAEAAHARLQSLIAHDPLLAPRIRELARTHGINIESSAVAIAAACAARHWGALAAVGRDVSLTKGDEAYLSALEKARKAKRNPTIRQFRSAARVDLPVLIPATAAILHRAAVRAWWAEGIETIVIALKCRLRSCAEGGREADAGIDAIVEHASIFLSSLGREVREAQASMGQDSNESTQAAARIAAVRTAWEAQAAALRDVASKLEPAAGTLLSTSIDSVEERLAASESPAAKLSVTP